ncbi:MAG: ankyrin repeat domain-containing protein [Candidatus Endonucleobacter bathymodioli]|uniref:Ankyrin repeat domain-containing protein n=1 Tax=Candidatus Endonucleibacter bathymodioli TaxID=539814 RepID=A0AA90NMH2_9GAMM|nr:ankyrin repeat domain-containing protein [Candidatus Endonucleobacter bathymodioli]
MNDELSNCNTYEPSQAWKPDSLKDAFHYLKYAFVLFVVVFIILPSYTLAVVRMDILFQPWKPTSIIPEDGNTAAEYQSDYIQLPEVHSYQELESHDLFLEIHAQFLNDIQKLKELACKYVGNMYNKNMNSFYRKMDMPPNNIKDSLLLLYMDTRFYIHKMVWQLEGDKDNSLGESSQKNYIASILHLCLDSINLCSAGVHDRFSLSFLNLEASGSGLYGHIFKVRLKLFQRCIGLFMVERQQREDFDIPAGMEVHWVNGLYNIFCDKLALPTIQDKMAKDILNNDISADFLSMVPLFVNSLTILRDLSAEWSDQLRTTLQENQVTAWETGVISSPELIPNIAAIMDSKIFLLINDWLHTHGVNALDFASIIEEVGDGQFSLERYRENILAWVINHFCKSRASVFADISSDTMSNCHIGTIANIFFWVFKSSERMQVGQECTFNNNNHITLELSHLTSLDYFKDSDITYALLTQALEQTNRAEDITSFFMRQGFSKKLCKEYPMVMQELSNQITSKLVNNGSYFKTTLCNSVCAKLLCSDKIVSPDALGWLLDTSWLEPVLIELQQNEMDITQITQSLGCRHIHGFSKKNLKELLTPNDCQRLFQQACAQNQAKTASSLLLTGNCDELINCLGNDKESPLLFFVRRNFLPAVKYLLDIDDTDIHYKDPKGNTALNMAASKDHVECVKILVAKGAKVHDRNNNGYTPLHSAACAGSVECVKALLTVDCSKVNTKSDISGHTALHLACFSGSVDCIEELLAVDGINVNKIDDYGRTPLNYAAVLGQTECISILLTDNRVDAYKASRDRNTPLLSAITRGHLESMQLLLDIGKGKTVNVRGKRDMTPLGKAVTMDLVDFVEHLLRVDSIKVNRRNFEGNTALNAAAYLGRVKCMKKLLAVDGIKVNMSNSFGVTPLYIAAKHGHSECVELLLSSNRIKAQKLSHSGKSALMTSIKYKHQDCAIHIINYIYAKINVTKRYFRNLLTEAKKQELPKVVEILEQKECGRYMHRVMSDLRLW